MQKKKKKQTNKLNDFFKSLKSILIISFIINIILLIFVYHLKTSNHLYIFFGQDEYLNINSGTLSLNYDINCLVGNNIEYINEKDIKIKEIKIGYYVYEDENLQEIISHYEKFETPTSLKNTIKNLTSLNVSEPKTNNEIFKNIAPKNIEDLYLIMEVKNEENENIISKIDLDVSKIK